MPAILHFIGLAKLYHKRGDNRTKLFGSLTVIHLLTLILLCGLIYAGAGSLNMLNYSLYIKISSLLFVATNICGSLFTLYLLNRKLLGYRDIPMVIWNIISILFCLWIL